MVELGVYIHYPWCRSRCSYCDFAIAIAPLGEIPHQRYLDAIVDELAVRRAEFSDRRLVSIYFGGGTPSLWPAECLARAVSAVRDALGGPADGSPLEITIEANPIDCTEEALASWRAAGINRVSIGVQSLDREDLIALGRDHQMGDGPRAVDNVKRAGFDRFSTDLILGAPTRRGGDPLLAAARFADLDAPHLSVYELAVEEGTPLHKRIARGEVEPLGDDRLGELYVETRELLLARGYQHYEVSSYAKPGARAIHNSLYWRGVEFLGLGCGAASFLRTEGGGGTRWTNHRSVGRYLAHPPDQRRAEREELPAGELLADLVWLGLRTSDGIAESKLADHPRLLEWLVGEAALAEVSGGRVRPTVRGFLYSNRVIERVLEEFRYPDRDQR